MRSRLLVAVTSGAVVLCISQWLAERWSAGLLNVPSGIPPTWHVALTVVLTSCAGVLPGLCAGFISRARGFVVGALAGAVGSLLYGTVQSALLVHAGALRHTQSAMFTFFGIYGIGLILTSAVGGGAGELLRSNNRLERSRVTSPLNQGGNR